jgi:carbon monoxide dehydrogenase subunit G
MPVIHKSMVISRPADRVFTILEDPHTLPQYAPGVSGVSEVQQSERRIGDTFKVAYEVVGIKFPLKFTTVEFDRPSKIVTHMDGGMRGTYNWSLQSQGSNTAVDVDLDYQVRGGIFGKMMNGLLVERMNDKNVEQMLENLKSLAEST